MSSSKPDLSSDLQYYSHTIGEVIITVPDRKSPQQNKFKRGRPSSGGSPEDREGSKTLKTDEPTPPKISNTDSLLASPSASPLKSLKTLTNGNNKDILSDSLSLYSPPHNQLKEISPADSNPHLHPENHITPQLLPIASTKSKNNSKMSDRPKPLRPQAKKLNGIDCVTRKSVFTHIIRTNGETDPPEDGPATLPKIHSAMSDAILSQQDLFCISMDLKLKQFLIDLLNKPPSKAKDFFKVDSEQLKELSDHSRQEACRVLDTQELKTLAHTHHSEAKSFISALIASNLPQMLVDNKTFFNSFLTSSPITTKANLEIVTMIIHAANFDSRWKSLLYNNLPTAKTSSSVHTLANEVKTLKIDSVNSKNKLTHTIHSISKAAQQIGHLKSSQVEQSYKEVENQLRIHNINTIVSEDKQDFRNLDIKQQEEEIKDIIKLHTTDPKAGSINIFKPKQGGKQFESLALITFKTTTLKYLFERNFAVWKRTNPTKNGKLSISRAPPHKNPRRGSQRQTK